MPWSLMQWCNIHSATRARKVCNDLHTQIHTHLHHSSRPDELWWRGTHIMVTFVDTVGTSLKWAPLQSSSRSMHWHSAGTSPSTERGERVGEIERQKRDDKVMHFHLDWLSERNRQKKQNFFFMNDKHINLPLEVFLWKSNFLDILRFKINQDSYRKITYQFISGRFYKVYFYFYLIFIPPIWWSF